MTESIDTDLARRVITAMFERDQASNFLGMKVLEVGPGMAVVSMTVRQEMLNGHHTCHGGFIFTLADSSFAFACNSRNDATVAAGCSIEYLRPARVGQVLTATAAERALPGRTGVYDVSVTDEKGELIALFRGKSHRIGGQVVSDGQA
ncbi:hydroxyphenylacetyl-CoA thioesterase PaaI [Solimonas soli]|uniref:hydroxyphenylacetyl-CoA thioesterase PaaI n=1 Tax=Solimonas soli TaxID=413479 RepID=UPI00048697E0|nr:hydroxyphenylacetyl-CoA thioesterase PaaI [Solimonas soli]